MPDSGGKERRKYVRINARHIIKCEIYSIPRSPAENLVSAHSKNLSAGGMLFESGRSFDSGEILRLELDIPGWEKYKAQFYKPDQTIVSKSLLVIGKVAHVAALADGRFDVGVDFIGLDDGHRWALAKYINTQIKE